MGLHPESKSADSPLPANASTTPTPTPNYPHWHDVIAGAAAGLGARAITAPLDLLKIRRQLAPPTSSSSSSTTKPRIFHSMAASHINTKKKTSSFLGGELKLVDDVFTIAKKEGGVRSLFRGNVAASYLWMGYSVSQFWIYGQTSKYLQKQYALWNAQQQFPNPNESNIMMSTSCAISFASGAIAGVCATIITYPFDLCRTVFAARGIFPIPASNVTWSKHTTELAKLRHEHFIHRRPPRTIQEFARDMYNRKGIRGFYAGSVPGLLQIIPYMGINFAVHDGLILLSGGRSDSSLSGVAGMGAGVISKLLVYPLDTVKKRLQAQAFWGSKPRTSSSTNYKAAIPTRSRVSSSNNISSHKNGPMKHNGGGGGPIMYEGMIDCFRQIAKREGLAAFYKGLVPSLLKSSASTGASFWLFTLTRNTLRSIHDSDHTFR
jgi:solute carrier family 25 thiamine pyrophosphate transporter 19